MLDATANLLKVTPIGTYSATDTAVTLSVADATKFPTAPFNVTWWQSSAYPDPSNDPKAEIVRVTAINLSTGVITITRAAEGPNSASTKNASGTYTMMLGITAKMITDIGNNLRLTWKCVPVTGTIDGVNVTFTIPSAPDDINSFMLRLARQPQEQGSTLDFTLSGVTITYNTPPDQSLAGQPHIAQYQ